MRIGYVNPEYGAMRNIIGKCYEHQYVRVRSLKSLYDKALTKVGLWRNGLRPYFFCGGIAEDFHKVDLLHFWNNIALWPCKTPYITSFEAELPRKFRSKGFLCKGFESMLSNQCKRLIAFSKHAKQVELNFAKMHGFPQVEDKMVVLLPPQKALVEEQDILRKFDIIRGPLSPLRLIFVGKDFFRKGGSEIVRALIKVRKDIEIEAFLVGDYEHIDYASSWEVDSVEEMNRLFAENEGWLHHYKSMHNADMLELAKTCHIGLLPTRDDTFGYSVLEFQGCGLPCITTNVCSLPEVNNDRVGWLINTSDKLDGGADFSTPERMRNLSRRIERGIVESLCSAIRSPDLIVERSRLAYANILTQHSLKNYSQCLGKIYHESVNT